MAYRLLLYDIIGPLENKAPNERLDIYTEHGFYTFH